MATYYVWSGSLQDDSDATWNSSTLAFKTLEAAFTAAAAGDTILIADDHYDYNSSSGTGFAFTSPGTTDNPCLIYSVNRATNLYSKATAVQIDRPEGNSDINFNGGARYFGVYFRSADDYSVNNTGNTVFTDCTFEFSDNTSTSFRVTSFYACVEFYSCLFKHNYSGTTRTYELFYLVDRVYVVLRDCTVTMVGSMTGDIIFTRTNAIIDIEGCDFSGVNADIFIQQGLSSAPVGRLLCRNTSIHPNVTTLVTTSGTDGRQRTYTEITGVDSGNRSERHLVANIYGQIENDTGVYRTASGVSWSYNVATNAFFQVLSNFVRFKLTNLVVDTSTAKTFTVEFAQDGTTTALTDEDIWIEVEYPDDTTTKGHIDSNRKANITATAAAHPDSTEAWTGLSATEKRQKMSVTTTQIGKSGVCTVWLYVAKPSITVYVDPDVTVA